MRIKLFPSLLLIIIFSCSDSDDPVSQVKASFRSAPTSLFSGEYVQFTDNSTGNPSSWQWEFEGGTPALSSEQNPQIQYNTPGNFSVKLKVSNGQTEDSEVMENVITVHPTEITVDIAPDKSNIYVGETVKFTDNSNGNPTSWFWNFQGGTPETSNEQNPSIQYNTVGVFSVTLTVSNQETEATKVYENLITVEDKLVVIDFTSNNTVVTAGRNISFFDNSTNNPDKWEWTFEGGSPKTSNQQDPVVYYTVPGEYQVKLKVTKNDYEDEIIKTNYIKVEAMTKPPFEGTVFIAPDIIKESDPTTYIKAESVGKGKKTVFDRRVGKWIEINAHLINLTYEGQKVIQAVVNPEFTSEEALQTAIHYGTSVGRIPKFLIKDVNELWIHKGKYPFGGGNNSILIHTDQGKEYEDGGFLEEAFIHEGGHTSLDAGHANSAGWLEAQNYDMVFISTYAMENSSQEDIAESILTYLAIKKRKSRLNDNLYYNIRAANKYRIEYFNKQNFNFYPVE
ncbi:PKD domain-containing protein [Marinigracilibium pacificum]|uniref:PKD domain-containing protein n=1 Tax=Marinigracilibium pacificum TaxID=2729599 RepID=A0A848J0P0_9BACT|nr:PKD domain-containing protein [Marinigracilibium pacificum]NMM47849.1 PKD domain-containing protein [Marinigracilibium pacificum]